MAEKRTFTTLYNDPSRGLGIKKIGFVKILADFRLRALPLPCIIQVKCDETQFCSEENHDRQYH